MKINDTFSQKKGVVFNFFKKALVSQKTKILKPPTMAL